MPDDAERDGRVRVLQSFPAPRPHRNPFTALLIQSLADEPTVELNLFSWRAALLGKYDVFHVHWPEIRLRGSSRLKSWVFQFLYAVLLLKLTLGKVAVVRTVHNLELPQGISAVERFLLRLTDRATTLRIALNTSTTFPADQPFEVIPHGHYRDWYESYRKPPAVPGQVGFIGLVRRYKGVDTLIRAFRETSDPALSLVVAGAPSTPELASALDRDARGDERIRLDLRLLEDSEFVGVVSQSDIVALPYRDMHNSAGALTALSLDRPVLVPRNLVNERLSEEVGPGWVVMYDGELSGDDLVRALGARDDQSAGRPDLTARDWSHCAPGHLRAYRRAILLRREPQP